MSAARRRGLVRRGCSWSQWDGWRYVRIFSGRRDFYVADVLRMAVGTGREPVFFSCIDDGPIDATDLIPGGAMLGDGLGGAWFIPVFRGEA